MRKSIGRLWIFFVGENKERLVEKLVIRFGFYENILDNDKEKWGECGEDSMIHITHFKI